MDGHGSDINGTSKCEIYSEQKLYAESETQWLLDP